MRIGFSDCAARRQVPIAGHVKDYAIQLVMASHPDNELATRHIKEFVLFGSSPRGVQSLILAGKVSPRIFSAIRCRRAGLATPLMSSIATL